MAKSSDAFRTIGEVSEELDVPKHVLRFWEGRFPQLKPMKRGGGRRFYRPEDLVLLRGIKELLHSSGYTIRGVQRILREEGVDAVKTLIANAAPQQADRRAGAVSKKAHAPIVLPKALRAALHEISRELDACLALARGTPLPAAGKAVGHAKARKTL